MVSEYQLPRALINLMGTAAWYAKGAPPLRKECPANSLESKPRDVKWIRRVDTKDPLVKIFTSCFWSTQLNAWELKADAVAALAKWIPSFLGIPRNSQKFPTMQISLHQISLEFLRIFGNGKLGLTLGLEFLGIPRNSKFYNFRSLRIVDNFWE